MIRVALAVSVPVLAVAITAVWLFSPPRPMPARFAAADCRHVELHDAESGRDITGAEDIVLAPDGTLLFAAQDRLDTTGPEGGLYAVDLEDLGTATRAPARPLLGPRGEAGPFRPHGVGLSADGARLAVINHVTKTESVIEVGTLGPGGWRLDRRIADPRLCRANDVVFAPGAEEVLRVTLDRADCTMSLRDLIGHTGRIARVDGEGLQIERTGLHFPNGLVDDWVAETRGHRLTGPGGAIILPGGPDNLGLSWGRIVAALHPNLLRTGLYLAGWVDRLPSRIVAVDPETGAVEVLFDDPEGALFSGATVGVLTGDRLVAGSVRDAGILVCEPAA